MQAVAAPLGICPNTKEQYSGFELPVQMKPAGHDSQPDTPSELHCPGEHCVGVRPFAQFIFAGHGLHSESFVESV